MWEWDFAFIISFIIFYDIILKLIKHRSRIDSTDREHCVLRRSTIEISIVTFRSLYTIFWKYFCKANFIFDWLRCSTTVKHLNLWSYRKRFSLLHCRRCILNYSYFTDSFPLNYVWHETTWWKKVSKTDWIINLTPSSRHTIYWDQYISTLTYATQYG